MFLYLGPLRERIRRFASEGHDVESASDMKEALDNDGGVKSVQTAVVTLQGIPSRTVLPKFQGIQQLNNFKCVVHVHLRHSG